MKLNDRGLEIIKKYDPEAEIQPAHDQIFVGNHEKSFSQMTKEEKQIMEEEGWFEDYESWSHFT